MSDDQLHTSDHATQPFYNFDLPLLAFTKYARWHELKVIQLPMGAKCSKITFCGLWVQRSSPVCNLFEQSSGAGSHKGRLPPINGWQVHDKRLTAYTLLDFFIAMT